MSDRQPMDDGAHVTGARAGSARDLVFPSGFLWGTATASHQVEGGNENNDWWAWEQVSGHIKGGGKSGIACDWWHRAEEDLSAAAALAQNSHRLSLEWSRLEPLPDAWHEASVARYRRILSHMVSLGMRPMVTLHHFTLPLWVSERGGWENPQITQWFAEYVRRAIDSLGDLCNLWCTINEPSLQAALGHVLGHWPPGCGGLGSARVAFRHMVRAHARAYEAIHRLQGTTEVGFAHHLRLFDAANPHRLGDRLAAGLLDHLMNACALLGIDEERLVFPFGFSLRGAGRFLDFVGLNYYSRDLVALDWHRKQDLYMRRFADPSNDFSMEGWGEIYPEGLYRALMRLGDLQRPIYVTEFGVPDNEDLQRPKFIISHVAAMHRAVRNGIDLRGAYFWSLIDNFEWAAGWTARFGLIHLDLETQERRLTRSAGVYGQIARANGLPRTLLEQLAPELSETRQTS